MKTVLYTTLKYIDNYLRDNKRHFIRLYLFFSFIFFNPCDVRAVIAG